MRSSLLTAAILGLLSPVSHALPPLLSSPSLLHPRAPPQEPPISPAASSDQLPQTPSLPPVPISELPPIFTHHFTYRTSGLTLYPTPPLHPTKHYTLQIQATSPIDWVGVFAYDRSPAPGASGPRLYPGGWTREAVLEVDVMAETRVTLKVDFERDDQPGEGWVALYESEADGSRSGDADPRTGALEWPFGVAGSADDPTRPGTPSAGDGGGAGFGADVPWWAMWGGVAVDTGGEQEKEKME